MVAAAEICTCAVAVGGDDEDGEEDVLNTPSSSILIALANYQKRKRCLSFVSSVAFNGKQYGGYKGNGKKESQQLAACSDARTVISEIIKSKRVLQAAKVFVSPTSEQWLVDATSGKKRKCKNKKAKKVDASYIFLIDGALVCRGSSNKLDGKIPSICLKSSRSNSDSRWS